MTTRSSRMPDSGRPTSDGPRRRILYVEDDIDIWNVTRYKLRAKYDLVHAASDKEACRLLSEEGETFHAVLMDIELKGSALNGLQLVQILRGTLPADERPAYAQQMPVSHVPVIMLSAYVGAYKEAELLALGADRALSKPVDFVDLTMALTELNLKQARGATRPSAS